MFSFEHLPFFDNHTHNIQTQNHVLEPLDLVLAFIHGYGDIPDAQGHKMEGSRGKQWCSPQYAQHVRNTGAAKTLIHLLSQKFGCEPTLEAVAAERNKRSSVDMFGYASELYKEANVLAEMVDSGVPWGDDSLNCFPARILRLFQMDPKFDELFAKCGGFEELKDAFDAEVRHALAQGFAGVKCHVFERLTQHPHKVDDARAASLYAAAKAGDAIALEDVYLAIFAHALILTQELNFPIHIHTGCTGNPGNGLIGNCDPYTIVPFLQDDRFYRANIVFLHANYPDIEHAALLTHSFPNVWIDLSWTLPWTSLSFSRSIEEALGICPHDKLMFGTGQHHHPEMVWMASKIAKSSLEYVLEKAVNTNLLSKPQALETAEQLLYKNAVRLYKL
ncbi:MAG: amidohydrolase [Oscillospiraceae bacterium]|nr:amidohydrolase [Oscillospiraceae bacterium]